MQAAARYELTANGQPQGERRGRMRTKPTGRRCESILWPHGTSIAINRHYKKPNSIRKFLESLIGIHDPSRGSALRRHQ